MSEPGTASKPGYFLLNIDGGHLPRQAGGPLTEAAIGVLLRTRRLATVARISRTIGPATHYEAEYVALIEGLKLAREHGVRQVRIFADREVVVDQVNRRSKVKQAHLVPFHEEACELLDLFDYRISWTPREWNREADQLVRDALGALELGGGSTRTRIDTRSDGL